MHKRFPLRTANILEVGVLFISHLLVCLTEILICKYGSFETGKNYRQVFIMFFNFHHVILLSCSLIDLIFASAQIIRMNAA